VSNRRAKGGREEAFILRKERGHTAGKKKKKEPAPGNKKKRDHKKGSDPISTVYRQERNGKEGNALWPDWKKHSPKKKQRLHLGPASSIGHREREEVVTGPSRPAPLGRTTAFDHFPTEKRRGHGGEGKGCRAIGKSATKKKRPDCNFEQNRGKER